MRLTPELGGLTIVLVGDFNPAIFRPDWLLSCGITSAEDAEKADTELVMPDMSAFKLPWAHIQVERHRFLIITQEEPFVRAHDLVAKVFLDQLPNTPIYQIGINRSAHFRLGSRSECDKIGFALAPVAPWGDWANGILQGGEKHGGMRSLMMEQSTVDDREFGCIRTTVQPSVKVVPGIWIEVNDHYQFDEAGALAAPAGTPLGSAKMIDLMVKQFDKSIARSEHIMDQVLKLA